MVAGIRRNINHTQPATGYTCVTREVVPSVSFWYLIHTNPHIEHLKKTFYRGQSVNRFLVEEGSDEKELTKAES